MVGMAKPVILTVDDDPVVLTAIDRDLRQHYRTEYRVMKAPSGAAALEAARELAARNTPIALFLVDQRMPGMTGTELLREVSKLHPESRRVLLTAYADTDVAHKRHQRDRARSLSHEALGSTRATAVSRTRRSSRRMARASPAGVRRHSCSSDPNGRRRRIRQKSFYRVTVCRTNGSTLTATRRRAHSRNRSPAVSHRLPVVIFADGSHAGGAVANRTRGEIGHADTSRASVL